MRLQRCWMCSADALRQILGGGGLDAALLLVDAAPLHPVGGDVPELVGHLGEQQLPHREDLQALVAETPT